MPRFSPRPLDPRHLSPRPNPEQLRGFDLASPLSDRPSVRRAVSFSFRAAPSRGYPRVHGDAAAISRPSPASHPTESSSRTSPIALNPALITPPRSLSHSEVRSVLVSTLGSAGNDATLGSQNYFELNILVLQ